MIKRIIFVGYGAKITEEEMMHEAEDTNFVPDCVTDYRRKYGIRVSTRTTGELDYCRRVYHTRQMGAFLVIAFSIASLVLIGVMFTMNKGVREKAHKPLVASRFHGAH
jgi:hypothetical protein